jgi:competence protein ComEC
MRSVGSSALAWTRAWRRSAAKGYRHQYGIFLALPLVWGCLETYVFPWYSMAGFLATAAFLELRPGRRLILQALLFAAWTSFLGFGQKAGREPEAAPVAAWQGLPGRVEGFAAQKPTGWTFTLASSRGSFRVIAERCAFSLRPGQTLAVTGRAAPPMPPTNPGQFDYPAYLRSQGLCGVIKADSVILLRAPPLPSRVIAASHDLLEEGLRRTIPPENLPLLTAMLLGETESLDPSVTDDFRASGMLHILAISGQHVGILALLLLQIFSLLRLPRKASFVVAACLLALYVPVSGGSVSVLRSAIMFWCALPSVLCERPALTLNNLGWSAALCLVWMPYQILSLGFQLSFAATFFLVLYSRPVSAWMTRHRVRNAVAVYFVSTPLLSLAIFLGLWPVLAATVHTTAPSSLIGNLATVGLSSGMLVAACLALLAYPILHPLGIYFGETAGAFASWLSASVHFLARAPGSNLSAAALPAAWSIFLLLLLLAFPRALRTRRGKVLVLIGLGAFSARWAGLEAWALWRRPHAVAFLDVGQGDGALLSLPGGTVLIDAGPQGAGEKFILPYLRSRGLDGIDLAVVTHPDLDHYGGLAYLASHIRLGKVVYPGEEADTHAWLDLKSALAQRHIPMIAVGRGQMLYRNEDVTLEVIGPAHPVGAAEGAFRGRNDNSVVCLLRLPHQRILFTGDMEVPAEEWLLSLPFGDLAGAALKVPHHGSDRSNAPEFLGAISPPVSVISAGRHNRFGHPGAATVAALQSLRSRVFITARDGAVLCEGDKSAESWRSQLGAGGKM